MLGDQDCACGLGLASTTIDGLERGLREDGLRVGETFFEAGPKSSNLVKNEDPDTDAVVVATFFVPVGAAPLTIPTEHLCGIEG